MKSYFQLLQEVLDQRAIVDNRNIVDITGVSDSVLIAFNQACEYMRDLHNWKWNTRTTTYVNTDAQTTYPMPYGVIQSMTYQAGTDGDKFVLNYVPELYDTVSTRPSQWTQDWENEEIIIAPAVDFDVDATSLMIMKYNDRNIAYITTRIEANLIPRFDTTIDTNTQYLNVPELVYDAYARCVILKTRLFLNEGAQGTVFPAQENEFNEAYNGLLSFSKTPFYTSERTEI